MWSTLLHVLMTAADQVKETILDLNQAFKDHGRFLARSILRLTGDGPHVEDILQETFIVAHRKQASFESRSSLRTWLYGIASNLCLHHRRSPRTRAHRTRESSDRTHRKPRWSGESRRSGPEQGPG